MTRELRPVVTAIIVRMLGAQPHELTPDRLFTDLGADELDQIEIIMALEDEFGFEIPDEDADTITSLGAAVRYIEEHGGWAR